MVLALSGRQDLGTPEKKQGPWKLKLASPFLKEETQVCFGADPWPCSLACHLSQKGPREWGSPNGMLTPLCSCSPACSARCIINAAGFISSFWVANLFLQS